MSIFFQCFILWERKTRSAPFFWIHTEIWWILSWPMSLPSIQADRLLWICCSVSVYNLVWVLVERTSLILPLYSSCGLVQWWIMCLIFFSTWWNGELPYFTRIEEFFSVICRIENPSLDGLITHCYYTVYSKMCKLYNYSYCRCLNKWAVVTL